MLRVKDNCLASILMGYKMKRSSDAVYVLVEHSYFCVGVRCTWATGATTWSHTQAVREARWR